MANPNELRSTKDLRELYDGDHDRFLKDATGKSADELRAMSFEERRRVLAIIGVNVPDQKPETPMKRAYFSD